MKKLMKYILLPVTNVTNSTLVIRQSLYFGSASDSGSRWNFALSNQKHYPRLTRHRYRIPAVVSQTEFCRETVDKVAKCPLSEANESFDCVSFARLFIFCNYLILTGRQWFETQSQWIQHAMRHANLAFQGKTCKRKCSVISMKISLNFLWSMFSSSVCLLLRVTLDISRIEIELQEERYSRFFFLCQTSSKSYTRRKLVELRRIILFYKILKS